MLTLFAMFAFLLIVGFPIAMSILLSSAVFLWLNDYPLMVVAQKMVTGIDSFTLIAVPLFILAGELMNVGKITDKIFDFAKALVGWIPGGLGHANVFASLIFAGMSGSAVADAGGLGTVEMEAMRKSGYDDEFSSAVTAASSTIGPIFPPSIPFVIYGGITDTSVGKLFLAGILPGLLMMFALMVLVYYYAIKRNYPRDPFSLEALGRNFIHALLPLLTPIIILSGFATGWFTPTEASSIAVIYSLFVGGVLYRQLSVKIIGGALLRAVYTSANVMMIIGSATIFSFILTNEGFTDQISSFLFGITTSKWVILIIINIILFLLGLVMEPGAILIMLLPVFLPIVLHLEINLVHFGVVMILNLMIGQITPPFGMCLFTIAQVANVPLGKISRSVIPFVIPLVIVLLLCTYVPVIVTCIPDWLMP